MKEKFLKKNKKIIKNNNGITLIALVITIIVMLILVAVTITMAVNGKLFDYAGQATKDTELAKQEELKLADGKIEVDGKKFNTLNEYVNALPQYSKSLLNSNGVLTKTVEYVDINNDTAVIPEGFAIVEDCKIINQGLVISDEFDNSENSIGNEFVWIPVPEKNMKVATISDTYEGENNYAEPAEITDYTDNDTSSQPGGPFKYDSQDELNWYYGTKTDGITPYFTYETDFAYEAHYKEMAESVNKYGGFYIGRYETTIDDNNKIGCKYNTTVLTSNEAIKEGTNPNNNQAYKYRWWGFYYAGRHVNIPGNGSSVQTNMVWGQQWDKMIEYFKKPEINILYARVYTSTAYNKPSSVLKSGQASWVRKTDSTDIELDKLFNIYDLRMNVYEWTAEEHFGYVTARGGWYGRPGSTDHRNTTNFVKKVADESVGTRFTLYIK